MTELDGLREQIDTIDAQIVRLLEERMELSRRIGAYKTAHGLPVLDGEREAAVIQSRTGLLQSKNNTDAIREIYELIMRLSRDNQGSGL